MGISDRGTKAKNITSCDNAFVTNIVLARDPAAKRSGSSDAPRKLCSVRKRSANVAAATKRPAGTEINPSFCQRTILYLI
ncbi:hypothetical protein ACQKNB_00585 [Lysinibacillus xylanilyticus]|uniref:hypothetical protein n=1 Tax=Lysinibacillus xylanilyticus TaxID=582475 RepID=UPI003D083471